MANDTQTRDAYGIARGACGTTTGDGTALAVTLGFQPKVVKLVNLDAGTSYEKIDGMTAAQSLKTVTAGAQTVDTGSAIILNNSGFTVAAGIMINTNKFVWSVF